MSISQTLNRAGTPLALDQVLGGTALTRIAFVASSAPQAQEGLERLTTRYGNVPVLDAQVVVPLGGDGFMLETMHSVLGRAIPVYGMNCGSVGFLMNSFIEEALPERLGAAQGAVLHPLRMHTVTQTGTVEEALALNEVSLLRQLRQTARFASRSTAGCGCRS